MPIFILKDSTSYFMPSALLDYDELAEEIKRINSKLVFQSRGILFMNYVKLMIISFFVSTFLVVSSPTVNSGFSDICSQPHHKPCIRGVFSQYIRGWLRSLSCHSDSPVRCALYIGGCTRVVTWEGTESIVGRFDNMGAGRPLHGKWWRLKQGKPVCKGHSRETRMPLWAGYYFSAGFNKIHCSWRTEKGRLGRHGLFVVVSVLVVIIKIFSVTCAWECKSKLNQWNPCSPSGITVGIVLVYCYIWVSWVIPYSYPNSAVGF